MTQRPYRFHQRWRMQGSQAAAFDILAEIASYPAWWPEVRSVRILDARRTAVSIRSVLPYTLHLELTRAIEDPDRGVLLVEMSGDLAGWDRWEIHADERGTIVEFTEVARLMRPWLRRVEPVARSAFIANHALMMRSCHRGLAAALAGHRIAHR